MKEALHLTQEQKLQQRLSPQQVQFVRLLEMNSLEVEDEVRHEILDNPAIEVAEQDDSQKNGSEEGGDESGEESEEKADDIAPDTTMARDADDPEDEVQALLALHRPGFDVFDHSGPMVRVHNRFADLKSHSH